MTALSVSIRCLCVGSANLIMWFGKTSGTPPTRVDTTKQPQLGVQRWEAGSVSRLHKAEEPVKAGDALPCCLQDRDTERLCERGIQENVAPHEHVTNFSMRHNTQELNTVVELMRERRGKEEGIKMCLPPEPPPPIPHQTAKLCKLLLGRPPAPLPIGPHLVPVAHLL